jgi:Domain of unknown function (DUF1127)
MDRSSSRLIHGIIRPRTAKQQIRFSALIILATSAWRIVSMRCRYWYKEWQIKTAAAELAAFDDRTLRDMGIQDRSRIERVVRYGRDY